MNNIISRSDARNAIEAEGAYLHDNGTLCVVWGNGERKTIRYYSFYALKEEMDLEESIDSNGKSYKLKASQA